MVPVMATSKQPAPAVMAVAAAIAIAIALATAAIMMHMLLAARCLLVATTRMVRMATMMPATPATPTATAAAAKQPGVGLRLQAHDDDAHRRQTQRQSDHISLHRSTSKNEQFHRSSFRFTNVAAASIASTKARVEDATTLSCRRTPPKVRSDRLH